MCCDGQNIVGVQSCGTDFAAHLRKITVEQSRNARLWLQAGGQIKLIGWRKVKEYRGSKRYKTAPRIKDITLETLDNAKAGNQKKQARETNKKVRQLPLL